MSVESLPEIVPLAEHGVRAALLWKLLGPSAQVIGQRLAETLDPLHILRLGKVLQNAARKVTDAPGRVNERVLGKTVEESAWIDDQVVVEYLGGILASAKTEEGRDDRGVTWVAMVGRLSAYQLRFHYILYTVARRLYPARIEAVADNDKLEADWIFLPTTVLDTAMAFGEDEDPVSIYDHCLFGLRTCDLIGKFVMGNVDYLRANVPAVPEAGLLFTARANGVELYLWGHGKGAQTLNSFLDPEDTYECPPEIAIPDGASLVSDLAAVDAESSISP